MSAGLETGFLFCRQKNTAEYETWAELQYNNGKINFADDTQSNLIENIKKGSGVNVQKGDTQYVFKLILVSAVAIEKYYVPKKTAVASAKSRSD